MKKICFLLCFLFFSGFSFSQTMQYFVGLKDKKNNKYTLSDSKKFLSEKSIERRKRQKISLNPRDLPVSAHYLGLIRKTGAKISYTSKWLNAVLLEATPEQIAQIRAFSFTKKLPYVHRGMRANLFKTSEVKPSQSPPKTFYGTALGQIRMLGIDQMHSKKFTGKGITIAIFDGGFSKADSDPALAKVYEEKRLLSTFNFWENSKNVFQGTNHGRDVFSVVAAYQPKTVIGAAYEAFFHLFTTEKISVETRLEEIYWLLAAEKADSLGADIILSSLGYNIFDNKADNYVRKQLNGNSALITVAADLAAAAGMLVVTSAGNEGRNAWRKILPPADGDSVLSVGAVAGDKKYAAFSSVGHSADGRVKPDVVAQGQSVVISNGRGGVKYGSGTSFAAPLVAGLAAGLWQAYPTLTNIQLLKLIRNSASQAAKPDSLLGYGIPNFTKANPQTVTATPLPYPKINIQIFPNPFLDNVSMIFPPQEVGKKFSIRLLTFGGKTIFRTSILLKQHTHTLSLPSELPAGVYLLRIRNKEASAAFRLVK